MNNNKNDNFNYKKKYGQCFLKDENVLRRIFTMSGVDKDTTVIEVGPGLGALTKYLIQSKDLYCYEIDQDAIDELNKQFKDKTNFHIIEGDILKKDLSVYNGIEKLYSVSNLPYYITTPIIDMFLNKSEVSKMIFMVQKEVAERLSAKVGTKDYNAFTIMVNTIADVKLLFNVSRKSFYPEPNVDSAIIEITRKENKIQIKNQKLFEKVVYGSFAQRRKTIYNNLNNTFKVDKELINAVLFNCGINPSLRAEVLTIDDFLNITKEIEKIL